MMTTKRRKMSDPSAWATDPAGLIPVLTPPGASGDGHDLIPTASIAASVSVQGETAGGDSVATPTERPLTESALSSPLETPTNTERHNIVTHCENCGDEFTPRRPHGRFCSAYCRRQAWLGRNPVKAVELAERGRQRLRERVIGYSRE